MSIDDLHGAQTTGKVLGFELRWQRTGRAPFITGFRVSGVGFWVLGFGFRVLGLGRGERNTGTIGKYRGSIEVLL